MLMMCFHVYPRGSAQHIHLRLLRTSLAYVMCSQMALALPPGMKYRQQDSTGPAQCMSFYWDALLYFL